MGKIKLISAGIYTSIQDNGRKGVAHFGVPTGGAMDMRSFFIANKILHKPKNSPAIEYALNPPSIQFYDRRYIAITGAVIQPFINDRPIKMNERVLVQSGDILTFGTVINGQYGYIGMSGDMHYEKIMGSHSTSPTAGILDLLKAGQEILLSPSHKEVKSKEESRIRNFSNELIVYRGPEYHLFKSKNLEKVFSQDFKVSMKSNRMSIELERETHYLCHSYSILSSGTLPGTVQVTPNGQLIVLMRDAQTTGGYPRIFQLASQSIDNLAQHRPGKCIRFREEIL